MLQDFRFGIRMLRRSPGFSLLAILCLTLGIGATTSVFSWIEGILLRPFPLVAHQERMMAVASTNRSAPGHDDVSSPDFRDFEKNCTLFDAFIVDRITGTTLSIGDRAEPQGADEVLEDDRPSRRIRERAHGGAKPPALTLRGRSSARPETAIPDRSR